MSKSRPVLSVVIALVLAGIVGPVTLGWAQAVPPPTPPAASPGAPPAGATGATGSAAGATAVVVVIVGLLVLVGVAVKFYDLKRKREAEAVHLQAQVSDALLREQALFGLPITPTAHVPLWKGSPATIELSGQVPNPEAREATLRIVKSEALRIRPDVEIEDRLAVVPSMAQRIA
jgi:hypothetical protein